MGAAWRGASKEGDDVVARAEAALRQARARGDATAVVWDDRVHQHLLDDPGAWSEVDPPVGRVRTAWAAWSRRRPGAASVALAAATYAGGLGGPLAIYAAVWWGWHVDPVNVAFYVCFTLLLLTTFMLYAEGLLALQPGRTPPEPECWPSATAIIPAWLPNEHAELPDTLRWFLDLPYPGDLQILCVYNTDRPLPAAEDELDRLAAEHPRLTVVRATESRTKAQNLNLALRLVSTEMVGIFDADHHPDPDALRRAGRWIAAGWDGVQGRCTVRLGDDPDRIQRLVAVEFEAIYGMSHPGRARRDQFAIFGGSNGYWRTSVLQALRFAPDRLTEDIDVSARALLAGLRLATDRSIVSSELAPADLSAFWVQRGRWAQGWTQVSHRWLRPLLRSELSRRQKAGAAMLFGLREVTPWVTLQVFPILGFHYLTNAGSRVVWLFPFFLVTGALNLGVAAWQAAVAWWWADPRHRVRSEYVRYALHSLLWFSEFKMLGSRVAHLRAALGETQWRVTRRAGSAQPASRPLAVRPRFADLGAARAALAAEGPTS